MNGRATTTYGSLLKPAKMDTRCSRRLSEVAGAARSDSAALS